MPDATVSDFKVCCGQFAKAWESGTDNEGWGTLISAPGDGEPSIGQELDPIKFCPWCGSRIERKEAK